MFLWCLFLSVALVGDSRWAQAGANRHSFPCFPTTHACFVVVQGRHICQFQSLIQNRSASPNPAGKWAGSRGSSCSRSEAARRSSTSDDEFRSCLKGAFLGPEQKHPPFARHLELVDREPGRSDRCADRNPPLKRQSFVEFPGGRTAHVGVGYRKTSGRRTSRVCAFKHSCS